MTPVVTERKSAILFINRSYWPDAEATGQLLGDLCESLTDRFEVSVLCGQPNSNPTNASFRTSGSQVHNGVTVHRLNHSQFNKRRGAGRIANLVSFTLAARRWLKHHNHYDVLISETDPFLLPLVVAPAARANRAAYIAYLQDIYPDIAIRLNKAKDGWFTRSLRKRLCSAYQSAAKVVVLSHTMKAELVGWGLSPDQLSIVPNWVNCDSVKPLKNANPFRTANQWNDSFVVMHSGNMGLSQTLGSLVDAVDHPAFPQNGKLALVGGGADEHNLRSLAAKSQRANDIQFFPYQPREQLSESLSAADVHVISVDPRIGGTMMPSKLYGILASGTPVVVIADPTSDVARIVSENKVGIIAKTHNPDQIAAAIASIASQTDAQRRAMQTRARALAEAEFDKPICTNQFAEILSQVTQRSELCPNR